MAELSAAEKRQQLRERRAAKMAKASGTRLNKIVNSTGSNIHELHSDETEKASPAPQASATSSQTSGSTRNQASKAAVHAEDPEVPSLDSLSEISDPLHGDSGSTPPSTEELFASLFQSHQQSPQHANGGDGPLPEDFMNTIGSLFGGGAGMPPPASAGTDSALKTHRADAFALARYVLVLLVFLFTCASSDSCFAVIYGSTTEPVVKPWFSRWFASPVIKSLSECNLWETFLALECVLSVIHLMLANTDSIPKRSRDSWAGLLLGFVPTGYKGVLTTGVDYFDVVVGAWRDLCLVFVLLMVKSYISNK